MKAPPPRLVTQECLLNREATSENVSEKLIPLISRVFGP